MAKEIKISLNTGNGQAEFETDKVEGKLNSIIIDSVDPVEVIIESELGYLLLHERKKSGDCHDGFHGAKIPDAFMHLHH